MTAARAAILAVLLAGVATSAARAVPAGAQLDPADISDAIALGLSRDEARRAQFHERYLVRADGPVVRSIEVITEFRRLVLLAEEQGRQGAASWQAERAAAALAPYRGRLDLVAHLRFDPQNSYRAMPRATLVIYPPAGGQAIPPTSVEATPANFAGPVPPGTPLLAATVEARFPSAAVDVSRPFLAGVFLDGRELQRIPLDLSGLR